MSTSGEKNGGQHHVKKGDMMLVLAVITRRLQQSLLGMAVVMLMMGSSSPVITKLALLVGKVDLGSREDLDVSANMISQFCFQRKKMFHLISFQPPCVVVVNMDGKSSEAADAVKREVKLVEKVL